MKYFDGKTVSLGIACILVFSANIPAIGFETEYIINGQPSDESEYIVFDSEENTVCLEEKSSEKKDINDAGGKRGPPTFYDGWYHKADTYEELVHWYLMLEQNYSDYIEVFKANELYNTGTVPDQNYDLYYVRVTNESLGFHKPEVFFSGTPHGDERVGTNSLYWAVDWLMRHAFHPNYDCPEREWLNWLLNNREIYICVCHNPWGWDHNTRFDFNGWDLNREADHLSQFNPPWQSVNGRTVKEFVNNHTLRIGVWFHDGVRAILYPWSAQHPGINGTSPLSNKTYEHVPADFYFYDAAGLRLGEYIGDYDGDLNSDNVANSHTFFGTTCGGIIPHWVYGADVEKNPVEDPYVQDEIFGNYPGAGLLGFTPEVTADRNASEIRFGNDVIHRFGAEVRRLVLFLTDLVQPSLHWISGTTENDIEIGVNETLSFNWQVNGCLVVDHTYIQWGTNPDPINHSEFNTSDHDEHAGDYYGGSVWDNAEDGMMNGTIYSETIEFDTLGDYYLVAKAQVDQIYADVLRPDYYGNRSYLRLIKERTNDSYYEEINGTDGLEQIYGQLWWYSPIIHVNVTSSSHNYSLSFFNWSSSKDWKNGTFSQIYIRDGNVGIGGYDDFEDYSISPLYGDWEERVSSNWWTFYNNAGDMCLKHEASSDSSRSMAITDQWGNISNSTIQAKIINVGDDAIAYLQSRVAWEKNTLSSNCDFYGCRNDLRSSRNRFEIIELDDGIFESLAYGDIGSAVNGSVYQKLMTIRNGVNTDLYAKVWKTSDVEPTWQLIETNEVTNDGAKDGCFGVYGFTDDIFYVSDFWLVGGYSSGCHLTEWKNAGRSVNWSEFEYSANRVFSGYQDIAINIQVSSDGQTVLGNISFYAENGDNEVNISNLPPSQYIRIMTNFTTSNETETAEITFYSIKLEPEAKISYHITSPNFEWNFVSIPFDQTINKEDIIVKYDGVDYNWTQATTDDNPTGGPIILSDVYTWLRIPQYYEFTDTLQSGYGCWMYAYYSCELWVEGIGSIDEDNYITDSASEWNIVGLPSNESLLKEDIVIRYNGIDYNWTQATTDDNPTGGPIILSDVYTWLRIPQYYGFTDMLQPGYGYWMYAYYNCTLFHLEG